jgi:hypothetical protein
VSNSARMHPTAQISMAFEKDQVQRIKKESNPMYLGIHFEGKHDLWCAIPPCSDVFRHQANFFATSDTGFNTSGETKIANFKVAIGI